MLTIKYFVTILLIVSIVIQFQKSAYAETLNSNNYMIEGFSYGTVGGEQNSSASFKLNLSAGGNLNDTKLSSSLYKLKTSSKDVYIANVPKLLCFETSTNVSTNCLNSSINPGGMEKVCGFGGCYNKAHFEIDTQNNPSDTLYSVQITTDSGWSSWQYIDSSTRMVESVATHDINDYQTKLVWENSAGIFNIVGLASGTQYYLRISALNGDFTESGAGPSVSATTSLPTSTIAISTRDINENLTFGGINLGVLSYGSISKSSNYLWVYLGSNVANGVSVYIRDMYHGLYSSANLYTLNSIDADLSLLSGFGVATSNASQDSLGPILLDNKYNVATNLIGGLSSSNWGNLLASSSNQPLVNGKFAVQFKAQPAEVTPISSDYSDTVYITLVSAL